MEEKHIGIVGSTRTGKTTLAQALAARMSEVFNAEQIEREENIQKLRQIGIDNPTDEDIGLIQFYMAGLSKENAIAAKKICNKNNIPYEVFLSHAVFKK